MAKKISSPAKALYIIFALALVFSAIPALAVTLATPAGANMVNGATAYGSDFILDEAGNGTARWVWDNIVEPDPPDDFNSATHSAYLKATDYGDSAMVIVTWGCTIGELTDTELGYWYRNPEETLGPIMGLAIDTPTHDGVPDMYAYVSPQPPFSPAWTQWSEDFTGAHWQIVGGSLVAWPTLVSTAGPDAKVLAVMVGYDYQRNLPGEYTGEAFVDDIKVRTRDWDLEPLETDCVKSELGAAFSGYPIQIEVDDYSADIQDWSYDEQSSTNPDGNTSVFDVAHAPKSVLKVTEAYDLVDPDLTVLSVAQVNGNGTITIDETPPAEYGLLACTHAEDNISLDSQPTTPTQLTVTTLVSEGNCTEIAPGVNDFLYVHITGTTLAGGGGTAINELLFFSTSSQKTTTQAFGTVNAAGVDAVYSANSAATAIKISAVNHVWFTYEWHQHDTVTVWAQTDPGGEQVAVTCIEVDPFTLEPDKDSGFFKGILYPVTSSTKIQSSPIPGLQRHDLYAPHCETIELKYPDPITDDIFAEFLVDNQPPTFSNASPTSTNLSLPVISVDIDDTKCDVTKDKISLYVSANDPPTDGEVAPADFDFANGTVTYTPSLPLTDGTYYVRVKAADCCWNWAEIDWDFEVESTPPRMIDAITGWTWRWGPKPMPQNTHSRISIMVVFSERLDPTTVQKTDFTVNYMTPVSATYYEYGGNWGCNQYCCDNPPNDGCHDYGLVFLTLATPLYTDAHPTVVQVGVVEDLAGNPCDKPYTWYCSEPQSLELPQTVTAQDGIGPAITVTATPEEPGYNETVTVTAVSSEPLSEAYLFVGSGYPGDYNWNHCKPIGWDLTGPPVPCDGPPWHVPSEVWDGYGHEDGPKWMVMTADPPGPTAKTWTATFTNEVIPNRDWFVEVAAHDFTQWWVDMDDPEDPGTWYDYECQDHAKCWKHEKWSEESLLFWGREADSEELCEGWNLISVPGELVDPSLQGFFGTRTNTGITKVYYWTGGDYGYWQYSLLNPVSGYWTGTITSIEPGKAYWVWVSPPEMKLWMHTKLPNPMNPPPSTPLKKGWNMVGYINIDQDSHTDAEDYLASICFFDNPVVVWDYDACDRGDKWEGAYWYHPGDANDDDKWCQDEDFRVGEGYWVSVSYDCILRPAGD